MLMAIGRALEHRMLVDWRAAWHSAGNWTIHDRHAVRRRRGFDLVTAVRCSWPMWCQEQLSLQLRDRRNGARAVRALATRDRYRRL